MGLAAGVAIGHVVVGLARLLGAGLAHDEMGLELSRNVSNYIIIEAVGVRGLLVRRGKVAPVGRGELVEVVVGVVVDRLAADLSALGNRRHVAECHDVSHEVITIGNVLDDPAFGGLNAPQRGESASCGVVRVGGRYIIAVGDGRSLAVLVVFEALYVGIPILTFHAVGFFEEPAVVVAVVQDFSVRVGHLDHPAEGVEGVLCGVFCPGHGRVVGIGLR